MKLEKVFSNERLKRILTIKKFLVFLLTIVTTKVMLLGVVALENELSKFFLAFTILSVAFAILQMIEPLKLP